MTLLDAIEVDYRNIGAVLADDRVVLEDLRRAAWLGSKMNEEIVLLRAQVARHANETIEKGAAILGLTE